MHFITFDFIPFLVHYQTTLLSVKEFSQVLDFKLKEYEAFQVFKDSRKPLFIGLNYYYYYYYYSSLS